jgi:hypothetical protein
METDVSGRFGKFSDQQDTDDMSTGLGSSEQGLSAAKVLERLAVYGPNRFGDENRACLNS